MIVNCGGNKIYVDDTLSITSVNAIQNKAVSIAINGIVARIDNIDTIIGNIQHDIGEIQGDVADLETGTAKLNGDNVFTGNNQFNVNPKGANPVSGAVDNSLVNANWISQTGNEKPNNLIHDSGFENIPGMKRGGLIANNFIEIDAFTLSRSGWHKIYIIESKQRWMGLLKVCRISNDYGLSRAAYKEIFVMINNTSLAEMCWVTNIGTGSFQIVLTFNGNVWEMWINCTTYIRHYFELDSLCYSWSATDAIIHLNPDVMNVVDKPSSNDYDIYIETVGNP